MQEKVIRLIISNLNQKYRNNGKKRKSELNKVMRFVKSCDYFKGKRKKLYKLIISAKR